jgi:CRISPR-associated protein Cas5a/b/c
MKFVFVRLRPTWGFACRLQPQSKMRMAFRYPPPTSLIGALAYPLLSRTEGRVEVIYRNKKPLSAAEIVKKYIMFVSTSFIGDSTIYGSLLRINRFYRGEVDYGITALPAVITYSAKDSFLDIIYVVDEINHELERAAWGITRVGSRESVFSAEEVLTGDVIETREREAKTRFSFLLRPGMEISGEGTILYAVDWRESDIGDYHERERKPYVYPEGYMIVRAKDEPMKVAMVEVFGKTEVLIL